MNQAEQSKILIRETCKKSLYFLCKALLKFKDVNERTHGEIISNLEADTVRKLICVPRGCLKSTLANVAYPIWLLINNPNLRVLIDSELYMNSSKFLREIKSHLETPLFTSIFGEFRGSTWNEDEILIKQRTVVKKEASITVGGIGTTKVGQHYDVIIGDDYNSPKNSNTPDNAAKVVDHYKYNTSILEPTGTYVIIGTRYSSSDCIGHILANELGIESGNETTGIFETISSEI
jgi:hypothetical protein